MRRGIGKKVSTILSRYRADVPANGTLLPANAGVQTPAAHQDYAPQIALAVHPFGPVRASV